MSRACPHTAAEPVTTVDGVHVGYLCPDCDTALDALDREVLGDA